LQPRPYEENEIINGSITVEVRRLISELKAKSIPTIFFSFLQFVFIEGAQVPTAGRRPQKFQESLKAEPTIQSTIQTMGKSYRNYMF
jgi:hypothetical protein